MIAQFGINSLVRCRNKCDGASEDNVTWCVNVWNHDDEVELCFDSTSEFTNISSMANTTQMHAHFNMPKVNAYFCRRVPCLVD